MRTRLLLAACLTVFALAAGQAPSSAASDPLQPGDYVGSSVGGCTLNFMYVGTAAANNGRVYLGTAAHCVKGVGETVVDQGGQAFGRVAFKGNENATADDYAFIEVFGNHVARVSPRMKGHTAYPRLGFTTSSQTGFGDQLVSSGYGVGFSVTNLTRERRPAVLTFDDASEYGTAGPFIFGDSGGPVVHQRTGRALGVVSRLCAGSCTQIGPTVEGVLARAHRAGFAVRLVTA